MGRVLRLIAGIPDAEGEGIARKCVNVSLVTKRTAPNFFFKKKIGYSAAYTGYTAPLQCA
jgi:hypothetical protein